MELRALTESEAALEAGVISETDDGLSFAEMARLLRTAVMSAGAIERDALLGRAEADAVFLGFPASAARARASATLAVLEAAGDLATIATNDGDIALTCPEQCVQIGGNSAVLLGGSESAVDTPSASAPSSIVRPAADLSSARPLEEFLGPPRWRSALSALGLPTQTDLSQATQLLLDAARVKGEPANIPPDGIWGRLDDAGGAFGLLEDGREAIFVLHPEEVARAISAPEIARWIALDLWGLELVADWSLPRPLPPQLLRALALVGAPEDDSLLRWQLPSDAASAIAAWAGLAGSSEGSSVRDADQDAVIHAAAPARLLVEAPPGCGKTWTACRRVSALVDGGTPPSRIWMISFTRVAVAEIRSRIAGLLREPADARDIRIITIDSLAWRLRQGFADPDMPTPAGYDGGIAETLNLLEAGDVQLIDFVAGIQHLVVDEAQDLSGDRNRLVAALIFRLSAECGVTVFYDPAQAIYGFSSADPGQPLSDRLAAAAPSFRRVALRSDHRTRSADLADLFRSMRLAITDNAPSPTDRYDAVRSAIELAAGATPAISVGKTTPPSSSALVLFRSRSAMLAASASHWAEGRSFRIRLTGRAEIVEPWIGALLVSCRGDRLDRTEFETLWRQLAPAPLLSRDTAWAVLRRIAPAGTGAVDLRRLADRLAASPPPLEVQQTDLGARSGPLLTTIHGAKGREAEEVHLMLPRRPEEASRTDWDEEARILFVGATRARTRLVIGSSHGYLHSLPGSKRLWQPWTRGGRTDVRVEVGLDEDVDQAPPELADDGTHGTQNLLWKHSWRPVPLRAEREHREWILHFDGGPDDGFRVGSLTATFGKSLREIAAAAAGPGAWPGGRIKGIYMVAARTAALPVGDGGPRFWLEPVIAGLPIVWLNPAR
ncbi:UvrD-helicase domain-containing protein [Sphingosinicella sp. YJ22]|uniref:UvrD-helicase domain-containing protein n=1 Tax=Sphingosinicella sp. YJ22 TaxID=1104780 RepID=UPI00140C0193|nr:UvrD-helicase domain-containing protein [Sphingosinicella sp. YJ22]